MLIVCPNAAIDHPVELSRLHPGTVQRTGPARSAAGGKGANVARAAAAVGGHPVVLAFLADSGGTYLAELFADEDLPLLPVPVDARPGTDGGPGRRASGLTGRAQCRQHPGHLRLRIGLSVHEQIGDGRPDHRPTHRFR